MDTGIIKKLLRTTRNKKKKHNNIVILARSKLNSIESIISEAFKDSEINNEEYTTIINEQENYRRLNEDIRIIRSQRSDTEKRKLTIQGKINRINKITRQNNEII